MQTRFKHIIGLSATAPDCTEFAAVDITTSTSGLYLDDMDQLNLNILDASSDCSTGSIWDLLFKARKNALKELETDLIVGTGAINKQAKEPYFGYIGQPNYRGALMVPNGSRQSLELQLPFRESVSLKIKRIGFLADSNSVVPVSISGYPEPFQVVVTQNTPSFLNLETPIQIPFEGQRLEFSYIADGFNPLNNETSCGCGVKDRKLAALIDNVLSRPASGIILDVEIACDPKNMIFLNHDQNYGIAQVLAYATRYKAAELLIERILNADNINRYTMLEPEYLYGKRSQFRKEYQTRINWLISSEGFNLGLDSCYVCKPATGFRKVGILA